MLDIFRTLPAVLARIENSDDAREAIVLLAWRKIAGEMLGEHTVPAGFGRGRLTVSVSGPTWQRHLQDLAPQMLYRLNSIIGMPLVNFIEFEVNEETVMADRAARRAAKRDPESDRRLAEREITPELADAASAIDDENLRAAFLAAAGSCLLRARGKAGTV